MQGKTFTEAAVPKTNTTWMIENAIARYSSPSNGTDMHVQLFRTRTGTTMQSWSTDEGKTWSFPQNSTLPNPNSRVSAADSAALPILAKTNACCPVAAMPIPRFTLLLGTLMHSSVKNLAVLLGLTTAS